MIVLAVDPSSKVWGWALAAVDDDGRNPEPRWLALGRVHAPEGWPFDRRIAHMSKMLVGEVFVTFSLPTVDVAVVEVSTKPQSREAGRSGHRIGMVGAGAALGLCGAFVHQVHAVEVADWTRHCPNKEKRARLSVMGVDLYKPDEDPGLDVADAVGLLRWWAQRRHAEHLLAQGTPAAPTPATPKRRKRA